MLQAQLVVVMHEDVFIYSRDLGTVSPSARKARALLALIAMAPLHSVKREEAAQTLWSGLDRSIALARLRDLIHQLRSELTKCNIIVLSVDPKTIRFADGVVVRIPMLEERKTASTSLGKRFLTKLNALDLNFDGWLAFERERVHDDLSLGRQGGEITSDQPPLIHDGTPLVYISMCDCVSDGAAEFAATLTDLVTHYMLQFKCCWIRSRDAIGSSLLHPESVAEPDFVVHMNLYTTDNTTQVSVHLASAHPTRRILWSDNIHEPHKISNNTISELGKKISARLSSSMLTPGVYDNKISLNRRVSAYALTIEALPQLYTLERQPFMRAGYLLKRAVDIDAESTQAHCWLAYWYVFLVGQGWAVNSRKAMQSAAYSAERALALDAFNATALTISGHVEAFLHRRLAVAEARHKVALRYNDASPLIWHLLGMTYAYLGNLNSATECIQRSLQLAPNERHSIFAEAALATVELLNSDYPRSVEIGRSVVDRFPCFTSALKTLLAALGHIGALREANKIKTQLLSLEPTFSTSRYALMSPFYRKVDTAQFLAGFKKAGLK